MNNEENQINQEQTASVPESKTKRKFLKLRFIVPAVIILFVIAGICGISYAKKKFKDGPHGFMIEMLTENLNLTADQKASVEKIKKEIREKMDARRNDRAEGMQEFADEFKKGSLDKNRLKEIHQKREADKEEMESFIMDKIIEFHGILTPEQRTQAANNMMNMKDKFHDRMKNKPGDRMHKGPVDKE